MRGLPEYLREYAEYQAHRYEQKNGEKSDYMGCGSVEDWVNSLTIVELLEHYEGMMTEREEEEARWRLMVT